MNKYILIRSLFASIVILALLIVTPRLNTHIVLTQEEANVITNCTDITEPGYYVLINNITGIQEGKDYCIGIFTDNIILDGQEYALISTTGEGEGIYVSQYNNITIKNLVIIGYTIGIYFSYSNSSTLENIIISNTSSTGIHLESSSNNTLINITTSNNGWSGIYLEWSSNNILENIVTSNNSQYGISLRESNSNVLKNVVFVNDGLFVYYSYNNIVVDSTVNGKPLIYLEGVENQVIDESTNPGQIILVNSTNIVIKNVEITNTNVGIEIYESNNITLTNITSNNSRGGIYLYGSSNNILENIVTSNNSQYGIYFRESSNNTLINITTSNNSWFGIILSRSSNNTLTNIASSNNSDFGIVLIYSSNNVLKNSIVYNNLNCGLYSYYSSYNLFYNNLFNNTVNVCIYFSVNYWNITKTPGTNIVGGPYLGGNYWSGYSDVCADGDGDWICDEPYVIDEYNIDYLPLKLFVPQLSYLFVVDTGGGVWYRVFDGENWSSWIPLGGIILDSPSATYYNGKIYVAVRGMGDSIWYGYIDVETGEFSGWIPIPGLTPSKPTLVSTPSGVLLIVRGLGNDIWIYPLTWPDPSWINIPGLTVDAPVAVAIENKVYIVVRGLDGYSLWYGVLDTSTWSFTGWNSIAGLTDSTPDLIIDKLTKVIYLAVKGIDGVVYINIYTESLGWHGWINIPGGVTDIGPALEIIKNKLIVVIKDMGQGIWINMKQLDGSWMGWTPIDGLTQYEPELLTIN